MQRTTVVLIALGVIGGMVGAVVGLSQHLQHPSPVKSGVFDTIPEDIGRRTYVMCMACHGVDGRGIAGFTPGLAG